MLLLAPDVPAARALAEAWASRSAVAGWQAASLRDAERLLRTGDADLAFVSTLSVLRDPDAFSVVPGVALVGGAADPVRLDVRSGLDAIRRVGIDPRHAQEALLAQVVLKELYDAQPSFVPLDPSAPEPADLDAVLRVGEAGSDGVALDLGREWFELTTRPFVWALLAAPVGTVAPDEARHLRDIAFGHDGPAGAGTDPGMGGVTLAGFAHAGLDEWVNHLFYHRALDAVPEIPFVVIPVEDDEAEA
ncbi:MAG: MqnA/MqnD/SBP family protein [Bacteroidota bacterium]